MLLKNRSVLYSTFLPQGVSFLLKIEHFSSYIGLADLVVGGHFLV